MPEAIIPGIDLGTTFSAIAYVDERGELIAIPNAEGELTTPSIVHVNADGSVIIGRPALAYPSDTASIFKRYMGATQNFALAGRSYTAVDLSAQVLRKLATDAVAYLKQPIHDVIISAPAYFGQREHQAVLDAAKQAGLNVIQIINEPTAATNVYLRNGVFNYHYTLVFDLGGGTFDTTLLEVNEQGPFVKMTEGSTNLGGQDFNNMIVTDLAHSYQEQYHQEIVGAARFRLNQQVERAKIALSQSERVEIAFAADGGPTMTHTLTRAEFEDQIAPTLLQIESLIKLLLMRAQLKPQNIGKVLLMGGSSRVPSVQALLRTMFGREPDASLDPDLSVAFGAALVGGWYARPGGGIALVADSVSRSLGVEALQVRGAAEARRVMSFVLPKGYPLDKWSEETAFHPDAESLARRRVTIKVYQGESGQLENNEYIGSFSIDLATDATPQTSIRVWMRLNQSSLLEMEVSVNGAAPIRTQFQLS